jgi:hypothetical protein
MHDAYTDSNQIHAVNGTGMKISHVGTSIIPTTSHNHVLNNVLHVPTAHKNIIYVHKFTLDNDMFIEFQSFYILIKDKK